MGARGATDWAGAPGGWGGVRLRRPCLKNQILFLHGGMDRKQVQAESLRTPWVPSGRRRGLGPGAHMAAPPPQRFRTPSGTRRHLKI